jgi:hypothetical protein
MDVGHLLGDLDERTGLQAIESTDLRHSGGWGVWLSVRRCPLPTRDRVTEDNYKKIKEDMSKRDVESILGKPTEDDPVSPRDPTGGTGCLWRGRNHSTIYLRFDKEGKIVDGSYHGPTEPEKQDLLERAIRAMGLDN